MTQEDLLAWSHVTCRLINRHETAGFDYLAAARSADTFDAKACYGMALIAQRTQAPAARFIAAARTRRGIDELIDGYPAW